MRSEYVYHRHGGGALKFSPAAVEQFRPFIQTCWSKREAGGVLLGRFIKGTNDIVVDRVTIPMQGDRRSRLGFFRNPAPHQAAIDEAWIQSDHTCNYLGGWHTHPEASPVPSRRDKRDWVGALRREIFDSSSLFFAILGTEEMRVWEGDRDRLEIAELILSVRDGDDNVINLDPP